MLNGNVNAINVTQIISTAPPPLPCSHIHYAALFILCSCKLNTKKIPKNTKEPTCSRRRPHLMGPQIAGEQKQRQRSQRSQRNRNRSASCPIKY